MELLIQNGTVVTMDRDHRVLPTADVLVQDGRIAKIGRVRQGRRARRVIDASGCVVIPGFVQGHLHACQTLFRNRADGLELLDWLRERIWPFEAAHDAQSLRASAEDSLRGDTAETSRVGPAPPGAIASSRSGDFTGR